MKKRLNIGCGNDYLDEYINLDKGNCKCDVKWDVEETPWPFEDNSMEMIFCKHLLEHINKDKIIPFFREVNRILQPVGIAEIFVPHYKSRIAFTDFTHISYFSEESLRYFQKDDPIHELGKVMGIDYNFDIEVSVYKEGYNDFFYNKVDYYRPDPLPEGHSPEIYISQELEDELRWSEKHNLSIYFKLKSTK